MNLYVDMLVMLVVIGYIGTMYVDVQPTYGSFKYWPRNLKYLVGTLGVVMVVAIVAAICMY